MADLCDPTNQDKRPHQMATSDTRGHAGDSIAAIFDRFWAKLMEHLQSMAPRHKPSQWNRADGERRSGNPLQGITKSRTTATHTKDPPGLRAARGKPQRCWPHRWRAAKRHSNKATTTHHSTSKGKTQDHDGTQVSGRRAPALAQLRAEGETRLSPTEMEPRLECGGPMRSSRTQKRG
ncbi:Hypothetical predicted protein [Pelobates cultripes]|uniref:Uncharacterized protein n=1 Tax=Pelobates cultripes TaxID=61616 RepID=A0AAD1TP14_PELCU|nr:Hypothetical predicted protein [Pelobates cultripes]